MPLPVLTPEQRQESLAKALEARRLRAAAKAELAKAPHTFAAVLHDLESPLADVKVVSVLQALPGIGKTTAEKIMAELNIHKDRKVRGLGRSQRAALAARFPAAA